VVREIEVDNKVTQLLRKSIPGLLLRFDWLAPEIRQLEFGGVKALVFHDKMGLTINNEDVVYAGNKYIVKCLMCN